MPRRRKPSGPFPDNPALADVIERNIDTMADVRTLTELLTATRA